MAIWNEQYEVYKNYVRNIAFFYKKRTDVRAYIEILLSLCAIIIFLIFAIRPTVITIAEKYQELQAKKQTVSQLDTKINLLEDANSLLQQEQQTLALLEEAIPQGSKPQDYVIQLDALATSKGLIIESMNMEATPVTLPVVLSETSTISWFPFTITVSGTYEQLRDFLSDVENLRRPIKLETVIFEETLTGTLQLTIQGEVPYYTYGVTQ